MTLLFIVNREKGNYFIDKIYVFEDKLIVDMLGFCRSGIELRKCRFLSLKMKSE